MRSSDKSTKPLTGSSTRSTTVTDSSDRSNVGSLDLPRTGTTAVGSLDLPRTGTTASSIRRSDRLTQDAKSSTPGGSSVESGAGIFYVTAGDGAYNNEAFLSDTSNPNAFDENMSGLDFEVPVDSLSQDDDAVSKAGISSDNVGGAAGVTYDKPVTGKSHHARKIHMKILKALNWSTGQADELIAHKDDTEDDAANKLALFFKMVRMKEIDEKRQANLLSSSKVQSLRPDFNNFLECLKSTLYNTGLTKESDELLRLSQSAECLSRAIYDTYASDKALHDIVYTVGLHLQNAHDEIKMLTDSQPDQQCLIS